MKVLHIFRNGCPTLTNPWDGSTRTTNVKHQAVKNNFSSPINVKRIAGQERYLTWETRHTYRNYVEKDKGKKQTQTLELQMKAKYLTRHQRDMQTSNGWKQLKMGFTGYCGHVNEPSCFSKADISCPVCVLSAAKTLRFLAISLFNNLLGNVAYFQMIYDLNFTISPGTAYF